VMAIRKTATTKLREPDKLTPATTDTTAVPVATATGIHNLDLVPGACRRPPARLLDMVCRKLL
jgi:hypothetical protein